MRTATEFVTAVENTLGWCPPDDGRPRWKVLSIEAGKVNRKIKTNPALYTWAATFTVYAEDENGELIVDGEGDFRHARTRTVTVGIQW